MVPPPPPGGDLGRLPPDMDVPAPAEVDPDPLTAAGESKGQRFGEAGGVEDDPRGAVLDLGHGALVPGLGEEGLALDRAPFPFAPPVEGIAVGVEADRDRAIVHHRALARGA